LSWGLWGELLAVASPGVELGEEDEVCACGAGTTSGFGSLQMQKLIYIYIYIYIYILLCNATFELLFSIKVLKCYM